ncbi:MAG: acyltransferase family protein [Prevotella sp.]
MKRNTSIDILKGIGILLVLTAHSLGGMLSHFAYTFHMPLFFIVTGLFISSFSSDMKKDASWTFIRWWKDRTRRDFMRLIVPALFTIAVIVCVESLSYFTSCHWLKNPMLILFNPSPEKPIGYVNMLGNLWFLFALFFGKQTFYFLSCLSGFCKVSVLSLVVGGGNSCNRSVVFCTVRGPYRNEHCAVYRHRLCC